MGSGLARVGWDAGDGARSHRRVVARLIEVDHEGHTNEEGSMTILFALALTATPTPPATTGSAQLEVPLRTPALLLGRFAELLNAGDLEALLSLYLPEAVFVPEPGVVAVGREQIRAALSSLLALSPVIETSIEGIHTSGDVALAVVQWRLRGTAPDGSIVEQEGRSADILRRQHDGSWLIAIDHP